ncbi:nucleoside triphosphate pyrophosphohydrolase [Chitinophaga tropicalis]|uniref:Nucleoside triphosphate pyrophosphohydrolase n=1 Tax=Chitinophaga tropicalis TaxID=2683588 RepID=A0A7K1U817_9BACT|nr:nucleoside triphosphate pyrophosphohydrolase [Chitinophaga tropicalis]MVT10517.1 nucleoside triphosphate pyrophosphohydrolase [Chitinophaga tropicalis]
MENNAAFNRLLGIMDDLREKCPWDKKQTIQSLRQQTIEELYELADAITDQDWKSMKEELGDLLLHIVFYARIAREQQQFTMEEVINGICEKLISRHPHIYGDVKVENEEQVKQNWEKLKLKEGKTSVLSGVPVALPALVKAMRLQSKAKQVGFEWDNADQVWDKVKEEMDELHEVVQSGVQEDIEDEFGDVLFSLVNYSRFLKVDAENALERTNKKFIRRFQQMEKIAAAQGKTLDEMSLTEMDGIWNEVKKSEK